MQPQVGDKFTITETMGRTTDCHIFSYSKEIDSFEVGVEKEYTWYVPRSKFLDGTYTLHTRPEYGGVLRLIDMRTHYETEKVSSE